MKDTAFSTAQTGSVRTDRGSDLLREFWEIWLNEQQFLRNHARTLASTCGCNVDDLTDEALLRAVSATLRGAGPQREARSWLKVLLDNTSVDQHRRRKRFEDPEKSGAFDVIADAWPNPERQLLSREQHRLVARALERLPAPLRVALVQRVVEGRSYRAIARAQATSAANARKRVQLARALLRHEGADDQGVARSRGPHDTRATRRFVRGA